MKSIVLFILMLIGMSFGCHTMHSISASTLRCVFPQLSSSKAELYASHFTRVISTGMDNSCAWAAFLGNVGTESNGLTEWTQNPCDQTYCGRGPLQITGESNYAYCARQSICNCPDIVSNPRQVADSTDIGMGTAACVWGSLSGRNMNGLADGSLQGFKYTAELINCGHLGCTPNGWASRQQYWASANKCLGN